MNLYILCIIQGSFSQGHNKFGEIRGLQCTCIALYSIFISVVKPISIWSKYDLDTIVTQGDLIYKSKNVLRYLYCHELPRSIEANGVSFPVLFTNDKFGVLHSGNTCVSEICDNLNETS